MTPDRSSIAGLLDADGWQLVTASTPKKGERVLAAIHHGPCGYLVVEAKRIGPGIHHTAEDSCVGWRPGHKHPAYWRPLPEFSAALLTALQSQEPVR